MPSSIDAQCESSWQGQLWPFSCAARGWPVHPVNPKLKAPLTSHGYKDATLDLELIEAWRTRWPPAVWSIATGEISGVVALDFDLRQKGGRIIWGIDGLVDTSARATVRVSKWSGRFDLGIVDGLVNLTADVIYAVGARLRRVQTGYLRSYVLFLVLAAIGIFALLSYVLVTLARAG